jgi:3-oxoacyl-[acyl-carrier-protein] synthase-1
MRRVVATGIGFITSIGNDKDAVRESLRELRHGIEPHPEFRDERIPVKLAGTIKEFDTGATGYDEWTIPERYDVPREVLRSLAPHSIYAYCALEQAIEDAGLSPEEVSHPRSGMHTASGGSPSRMYRSLDVLHQRGVQRCSPMWLISSIAGTLNFNLAAAFAIKGSSCGFVSACSSSGHALGHAFDEIVNGRQDRMLVVGGEDGDLEGIIPFAAMRALSTCSDPDRASRPFDCDRDGFVGTGGAAAVVLEEMETARQRSARGYAEFLGWGQASDGFHVAKSHPEGNGLASAIECALRATRISPEAVDYVNAHATSTPPGDRSELLALNRIFGGNGAGPAISSTKALTGHGLSLASIMEAGFSLLAIRDGFMPGSAHIENLDPAAGKLRVIRESIDDAPKTVLSNSSGFGGTNVALIFRAL